MPHNKYFRLCGSHKITVAYSLFYFYNPLNVKTILSSVGHTQIGPRLRLTEGPPFASPALFSPSIALGEEITWSNTRILSSLLGGEVGRVNINKGGFGKLRHLVTSLLDFSFSLYVCITHNAMPVSGLKLKNWKLLLLCLST